MKLECPKGCPNGTFQTIRTTEILISVNTAGEFLDSRTRNFPHEKFREVDCDYACTSCYERASVYSDAKARIMDKWFYVENVKYTDQGYREKIIDALVEQCGIDRETASGFDEHGYISRLSYLKGRENESN